MESEWIREDESLEDLQNGFFLIQKKEGFRFGVDAVLLSDFAKIKKGETVLEMGSGTGVIPILLASRYHPARIEALEIQEHMAEMGNRSFRLNKLDHFVHMNPMDLKDAVGAFGKAVFDVVVTNPPYMKAQGGVNCPQEERNIACFEVKCTIEDIVNNARDLLRTGGRFYMVHRADRLADIIYTMRNAGLEPKRMRFVQSKPNSKPHLVLICGVRNGGPELKLEEPLIIYHMDGSYTEEIHRIYDRRSQENPLSREIQPKASEEKKLKERTDKKKGSLYLCGTPIGNLGDASTRLKEILAMVDLVAAEDTRESIKLLNHFEIKNKLFSYHEHNKREAGPVLIEKMLAGENIALVSDAGMPGISDPGEDLVKLCIEKAIEIVPVPGPSAAITALVVSGLPCDRFSFEGFLPKGKKEKKQRLEELKEECRTMIFYEAPHRLLDFLEELEKNFGDREISVSRELTKKFEEHKRGKISELMAYFKEKGVRGEFVIIVRGSDENFIEKSQKKWDNITVADHVLHYMKEGLDKKDAMKQVALDRGIPKREVYHSILEADIE